MRKHHCLLGICFVMAFCCQSYGQAKPATYTRHLIFNPSDHTLTVGKLEGSNVEPANDIVIPPNSTVLITIKKAPDKAFDEKIWADTWHQWFEWVEERKDGKDTVKTTVSAESTQPKYVTISNGSVAISGVAKAADTAKSKTEKLTKETTKIEVDTPSTLIFQGVVDKNPPSPMLEKPDPRAVPSKGWESPKQKAVNKLGVWYVLEIKVYN